MIIDKEKTASFDVDCQKGFTPLCPDELPVPDGHLIVSELNANSLFAKYRIGSKDFHPSNAIWIADETHPQFTPVEGKNVDIRWNKHCMSGTYGAELLDGLPHPTQYNYFIFKGIEPDLHPYSACYHDLQKTLSTGVIEYLREHKVTCVIVGGLAANYCVLETVKDLIDSGFDVIVNISSTKAIGDMKEAIGKLISAGAYVVDNTTNIEMI